ncbi:hypothetical protein HX088_03325 [Empedobacter sp. 225-1]|uniref:hypothetical protein n=1 Tax=Empedobacter sp. 225-1 TaxID=2746725 RepID=UPI002575D13B|nr:hypothetical protein [Empedobacter sp. 225-1]MDM1522307.1 hypothetical protein [Empedobacter sp. 225-1]
MKKNVLIIAYAYPPNNVAGAQRPYAIAKYLDKSKYNIKVLTCENPDLPLGKSESFDNNLDGVEIFTVKSKLSNKVAQVNHSVKKSKNGIKTKVIKLIKSFVFPDKGMFWYPNVINFIKDNKKMFNDLDIVISTSPGVTNHRIAKYLKIKNRDLTWIADFRDFNYLNHWNEVKGLKSILHKRLEASILKNADFITYVTNTMLKVNQAYYKKYSHKMHCIYNGFEGTNLELTDNCKHIKSTDKIKIFYAGTFYNGIRSPFPLLDLLDKAINEKIITLEQVELIIAGNIEKELIESMKNYKCFSSIQFLGNIPRSEVIKYQMKASFLWLIVGNIKAHYQTVPLKLFEYISTGKPILNFAPNISESSFIIENNNLGYNFNTSNFQVEIESLKFNKVLSDYLNDNIVLNSGNIEIFTWQNQIKKLDKLLCTKS